MDRDNIIRVFVEILHRINLEPYDFFGMLLSFFMMLIILTLLSYPFVFLVYSYRDIKEELSIYLQTKDPESEIYNELAGYWDKILLTKHFPEFSRALIHSLIYPYSSWIMPEDKIEGEFFRVGLAFVPLPIWKNISYYFQEELGKEDIIYMKKIIALLEETSEKKKTDENIRLMKKRIIAWFRVNYGKKKPITEEQFLINSMIRYSKIGIIIASLIGTKKYHKIHFMSVYVLSIIAGILKIPLAIFFAVAS